MVCQFLITELDSRCHSAGGLLVNSYTKQLPNSTNMGTQTEPPEDEESEPLVSNDINEKLFFPAIDCQIQMGRWRSDANEKIKRINKVRSCNPVAFIHLYCNEYMNLTYNALATVLVGFMIFSRASSNLSFNTNKSIDPNSAEGRLYCKAGFDVGD